MLDSLVGRQSKHIHIVLRPYPSLMSFIASCLQQAKNPRLNYSAIKRITHLQSAHPYIEKGKPPTPLVAWPTPFHSALYSSMTSPCVS